MVRISGLDPQNEIASNIVPSRSLSQNVFFNVGPTTHSVCLFVCSPLGLHCTRTPFLTFSRSSLSSFQPIILYHSSLSTKILRFFAVTLMHQQREPFHYVSILSWTTQQLCWVTGGYVEAMKAKSHIHCSNNNTFKLWIPFKTQRSTLQEKRIHWIQVIFILLSAFTLKRGDLGGPHSLIYSTIVKNKTQNSKERTMTVFAS